MSEKKKKMSMKALILRYLHPFSDLQISQGHTT